MMINEAAPDFEENAFVGEEIRKISLNDYRGKWVVLFFYPADFTFVCPTELGELADKYDEIKNLEKPPSELMGSEEDEKDDQEENDLNKLFYKFRK